MLFQVNHPHAPLHPERRVLVDLVVAIGLAWWIDRHRVYEREHARLLQTMAQLKFVQEKLYWISIGQRGPGPTAGQVTVLKLVPFQVYHPRRPANPTCHNRRLER